MGLTLNFHSVVGRGALADDINGAAGVKRGVLPLHGLESQFRARQGAVVRAIVDRRQNAIGERHVRRVLEPFDGCRRICVGDALQAHEAHRVLKSVAQHPRACLKPHNWRICAKIKISLYM